MNHWQTLETLGLENFSGRSRSSLFFKTKGHRGDVGKQPAEVIPIRSAGKRYTEEKIDAGEKTRSDLGRLQEARQAGKERLPVNTPISVCSL